MKSTVKDPWRTSCDESSSCDEELHPEEDPSLSFEDSFVASGGSVDNNVDGTTTARLPDSEEYLASLESKLAKLKSKRRGKDMVKSLEEQNKSSMIRFLSDENRTVLSEDDFMLDTPIPISSSDPIMRHVAPDKQALTYGELVELLKADQLAQVLEQHEAEEGIRVDESPN